MGLFKSKVRLIRTSYGYDPPPDAGVWGWQCSSRNCGVTEDGVPRGGWPAPCPRCGAPTDPAFEEPWKHDARGVEIRHLLATGVEDGRFTANQLFIWRNEDALRRGDREEALRVRLEYRHAYPPDRDDGPVTGSGYFSFVLASLRAEDLDAAADDLLVWLDRTSGEGVENDGSRRGSYRQAISGAIEFLDAPGAATHPQAPLVRRKCLELAGAAYSELLPQQQDRIMEMSGEA
jgi:hypothetical protein